MRRQPAPYNTNKQEPSKPCAKNGKYTWSAVQDKHSTTRSSSNQSDWIAEMSRRELYASAHPNSPPRCWIKNLQKTKWPTRSRKVIQIP